MCGQWGAAPAVCRRLSPQRARLSPEDTGGFSRTMPSSAWLCGVLPPCRMPPHTLDGAAGVGCSAESASECFPEPKPELKGLGFKRAGYTEGSSSVSPISEAGKSERSQLGFNVSGLGPARGCAALPAAMEQPWGGKGPVRVPGHTCALLPAPGHSRGAGSDCRQPRCSPAGFSPSPWIYK